MDKNDDLDFESNEKNELEAHAKMHIIAEKLGLKLDKEKYPLK